MRKVKEGETTNDLFAFLTTDASKRKERLALLQRMHKQWPFFRTLLSNLDMVLAKSDLRIAMRYVELVEDPKLAKRIFSAVRAEWDRAHEAHDGRRRAAAPRRCERHRLPDHQRQQGTGTQKRVSGSSGA